MARVVSLFLPSWPTDRLRRTLGAPRRWLRRRLFWPPDGRGGWSWPSTRPRGARLARWYARRKAQALVPGLIMRDADPAADAKALDRLALWALQRYAPVAAADPPDGLVIDTTGAAHLHAGKTPC